MNQAFAGAFIGLVTGSLSVYSLWLITCVAAKIASTIPATPYVERPDFYDRPTRWDPDPPEPDETPETPASLAPSTEKSQLGHATLRLFFAFLLKAPLIIAVAFGVQRIGTVALYWCVGAIVLVYFLAVFWASRRTHRL